MRNEERKRKLKKFALIFGGISALLVLVFSGLQLFVTSVLSDFRIESNYLTCTDHSQVEGFLRNQKTNYFYFKKDGLENSLKQKFFCIGRIDAEISFPNRLKVKIYEREPVFAVTSVNTPIETNPQIILNTEDPVASESTREAFPPKVLNEIITAYKNASESGVFLVDKEGVIFDDLEGPLIYPQISFFSEELKIGHKIPDDLIGKTLEVSEKLKEMEAFADNLVIVGNRLIIDSKPRIIFALNKPINRQTASLQLILTQAKMNSDPGRMDSNGIESIDLRFDKPVVVYSSKR